MWTHRAERLVAGEPSAVHRRLATLVADLWQDRSRTLLDLPGTRIDAIATDAGSEEADVWVTWRLADRPGGTWVEVQLDELEQGPDPTGELTELLDILARRLADSEAT